MNDFSTMRGPDRADTGQWRLVIYITRTSIEAWLQPIADRQASRRIVRCEWEPVGEGADLLQKIENAVYDHPQLLDDFSADIIIETNRSMWVPSEIAEDEQRSEDLFYRVYKFDADDMTVDHVGDKCLMWALTPGLPAFLGRTFPGARISAHLSVIQSYIDSLALTDKELMILNLRKGSCDIILMRENQLQTSSTQPAVNPEEGMYRLLRAADAYNFSLRTARLGVRDECGDDSALSDALEGLQLDASALIEEERRMPTAALLLLSK